MNVHFEAHRSDFEAFCEISREVSLRYFRRSPEDQGLDIKPDDSPVTAADREIEKRIRERIEKKYPRHGIIGEEYGNTNADAEFVWVLDPIDGTKSFITGVPLFGTLIALMKEGRPELGMIYQPIQDDLLTGDNHTAHWNGRPVRMRETSHISHAVLLTTDIADVDQHRNLERFLDLSRRVSFMRTWGDAWGYFLLSTGFADIMVDPVMKPWDIMALIPVVRGAGGMISDWQGRDPVSADSIVAAHPNLHGAVLEILNG